MVIAACLGAPPFLLVPRLLPLLVDDLGDAAAGLGDDGLGDKGLGETLRFGADPSAERPGSAPAAASTEWVRADACAPGTARTGRPGERGDMPPGERGGKPGERGWCGPGEFGRLLEFVFELFWEHSEPPSLPSDSVWALLAVGVPDAAVAAPDTAAATDPAGADAAAPAC